MSKDRFEFGKNWNKFLKNLDETKIEKAVDSLKEWLKKHRQGVRRVEKALFLQEKKQEQKPAEMKPQTPEEELVYLRKELDKAQQELTEAKRALATSELRNEALNTLIDIAERQGIKIRKNSGAKR